MNYIEPLQSSWSRLTITASFPREEALMVTTPHALVLRACLHDDEIPAFHMHLRVPNSRYAAHIITILTCLFMVAVLAAWKQSAKMLNVSTKNSIL